MAMLFLPYPSSPAAAGEGIHYVDPQGRFSLDVPEGWEQSEHSKRADVVFDRDYYGAFYIRITEDAPIRSTDELDDAELEEFAEQAAGKEAAGALLVGKGVTRINNGKAGWVSLDNYEGRNITLSYRVVYVHDSVQYLFICFGLPDMFLEVRKDCEAALGTFRMLEGE